MITKGLQRTAALWPPIKDAYALVHQAAHILGNSQQQTGVQVRETYLAWIAHMQQQKASLGPLSTVIDHFRTILLLASFTAMMSRSYRAPTMTWSIVLALPGLMSGRPQADVGLFLGSWCVARFV